MKNWPDAKQLPNVAAGKVQEFTMASDPYTASRKVGQQGWRGVASSHCIKIRKGKGAPYK